MKLGALIFDVDGTLADTEEAHRCAFNEAFQQLGIGWNWSRPTYAHLLRTTGGKERLAAHIASLPLAPANRQALLERVEEIHRAKTRNYTRMVLAGECPLRDGVARLLDEAARRRIRLGIATTTTFANIEALLCTCLGANALDRFAVIGAGDQVARKKPAPDIYEYVLQQLGLAPDECVALEDSANGLCSAKAAGLFTIVTPSYWTRTEDFSTADLVVPSLGSAERPLPPRVAALVGNDMLGIAEIIRQLSAARVNDVRAAAVKSIDGAANDGKAADVTRYDAKAHDGKAADVTTDDVKPGKAADVAMYDAKAYDGKAADVAAND